ncbi:Phenylalanyl-tRNA synthetase subunit beta [Candidatus Protofrankia californiensis]|uniref:Phenylalanine--tRNA ligase beta subunit n=1 Tax=Candidatus Protofrankia californiensis TaxID=1839754 RepID=A0A1C3P9D5_9ACTN|nr:Phenylalanyl-tRNA synthetase subunit beta [Candidatus Protofrankia californiensis]
MKIVMSWLREAVPALPPAKAVADALIRAGFEVEAVESVGHDVAGVVAGEVVSIELVQTKKKDVRWVQVRVAETGTRGVICGAFNFEVGNRVAVALPGAVLPGGFTITARKTYGQVSEGMICSASELGIGDDHSGILVLPPDTPLGADVAELLELADDVLDIAVTPDRGYGLSLRGIAREAATAFGLAFDDPTVVAAVPGGRDGVREQAAPGHLEHVVPEQAVPERGAVGYPVVVEDTAACSRYVARVVTGVRPGAVTPLRLARRLALSGMRPISVPVDVTNLIMLGLGQPLHAFDRAKLSGPIVVRRARDGERLVTLDGVKRELDPEDLVIADDSGPVALAGVMGGASTEISSDTTEILIEAAHFDPVAVARTARRHQLGSEASRRFERGVDPALAPAAARAALRLLAELAGATAETGVTDIDHRPSPRAITFPLAETARLGGRPYPEEVVRRRLVEVGCTVADSAGPAGAAGTAGPAAPADSAGGATLLVTPPSWRGDLTRSADLVEEVMRLEGYDTIPVTLPRLPAGRGLTQGQRMRRAVDAALAHQGYVEVLTVPFVGDDTPDRLGLTGDDARAAVVRIANPIAEDASNLRTTLLPGLFAAAVRNIGRGQADLALFETGLVFRSVVTVATPPTPPLTPAVDHRPGDAEIAALNAVLPEQPRLVAVVLTGRREPAGWWGPGQLATWQDAVDAAHTVAEATGVELAVAADAVMPWHPGRCARLSADGRVVGYAGELHPRVIAAYGLPARTCAMELDLDTVIEIASSRPPVTAPAVSTYPPADRDIALVVEAGVPVARVTEALRRGAGDLLETLTLFDVYEGSQVGDGQRSLAFGLRLRAADRTLTAQEANAARDAAIAEAARLTGAILRT